MEQDPHLLVYRASAGSGKTFTLAVEYIRQLIEDPFAYRRILAVTFTNKATTEMKERILSQLYGIAHKDPASDGYLNKIREHSSKSDTEIREAAAQALKNIIHDYSRFRIETIDSFFQSVMRNLARELELGANLNIELNNGEVLSDAVDSMIEKLDRRSPVLHWLLEYIENRISDNSRWNVSGEIKSFGRNIFNEVYLEKGQNLREKLGNTQFIAGYRKRLNQLKQETEESMQGFSQHFEEVLQQHGLEPNDLKSGRNGIGSYFRKLANGNFKEDVRNATVEKCLEAPENWTTKTSVNKDVIIGLAQSELMETLATAEELRPRANLKVNSCSLASRYLYNLPLLVHIDQEVRLLNEAHNRFLLSDTNALLHGLIREGDASFIYEKIGTTIDVVMIDEFQDTSRMQWENFHLLLEECLAQKDGSLIVGDIKQSIYRWRNGDWRILAGLDRDPSFRVRTQTLDTNWRSEANIIHFNNLFFEETCRQLAQEDASIGKEGYPQILDIYQDVAQKTQKQEKGFVRVSLIPDNRNREAYQETVLHELGKQVDELVQSGIRENEIAILIRKNNLIPLIADYFDKNTPYHIVSDEAFCMDASTAVCMLVDCLRYLANPDDRIACARLAVAYQHDVLEKDIDLNTVLLNRVEDYLPQAFTEQLEKWRLLPLYELLEQLFILFEMKRIQKQDAYICAFYDAVTEYLQNKSSELTAFITYWDETLHAKTIPSGELSGIRILSIHKSKGLEFHTVLLPFCDWKTENETNNHLIWCTVPQDQQVAPVFDELDLIPVNYSSAMKESVFRDSYLEEQHNLWVDNMNLLYVAFTRACQNLFVWGRQGGTGTVSQWLEETLLALSARDKVTLRQEEAANETDNEKESATTTIFEYGTLAAPERKEKESDKAASANRLTAPRTAVTISLDSLQEQTDIEFRQSNRSAAFIDTEGDEDEVNYADRGSLLHYLFACIKQADDLEGALEQLRFEGLFRSEEEEAQVARIARKVLDMPQIKDWFGPEWEVYNECTIISPTADGGVRSERPDRVMKKGDRLVVIDFKFARKNPRHAEQVREYMQLLHQMGYAQVSGFLLYGYSQELEEITE